MNLPHGAAAASSVGGFWHGRAAVEANPQLARDTYLLRLRAPELGNAIRPGQFVMLRIPSRTDPLLGRPFALYDTVVDATGQVTGVDVVYLVIGKMTRLMATLSAGDEIEVWGPLGNGFPDLSGRQHIALVAGGIGQTPFLAHIRDLLGQRGYGGQPPRPQVDRVSLYYGVRTAVLAAGVEDFRTSGAEVHIATDDGSLGHHGFVTSLLDQHLGAANFGFALQHVVGCGPEPMLHALRQLAQRWRLPCHVSLETPMACGVGICFSCVTAVKTEDGWDYKRVCVDGPVFDAAMLE